LGLVVQGLPTVATAHFLQLHPLVEVLVLLVLLRLVLRVVLVVAAAAIVVLRVAQERPTKATQAVRALMREATSAMAVVVAGPVLWEQQVVSIVVVRVALAFLVL